ncbi:MAG: SDR family oxidoreductase [Chloroflexi bacterium]|nr:SDR family oxidoreductase [Chloroflexota bacterium]
MSRIASKVVLITGASSGLGLATAQRLHALSHRVYGASRSSAPGATYTTLRMDVDDDGAVQRGVDEILSREGRLDAVLNNAGIGFAGSIEDLTLAEARQQLETNFFGAVRVCRAVLPAMRRQGAGLIINVASIGAQIALPYQGHYTASKLALEGMSQSLRMEVRPFGIRVVVFAPGDFQTGFTEHRLRGRQTAKESAYALSFLRTLTVVERDERTGLNPERFARLVEHIVASRNPRPRYVIGPAFERLALAPKAVLPATWLEAGVRWYYRAG